MPFEILLDSNIIIYAAEPGYDALRRFIVKHDLAVVSVISKVEVLGYHALGLEDWNKFKAIFQALSVLPLSDEIFDQAIVLRQQKKMSLGDALIAATALVRHIKLATANVKDFKWIEELELVNPLIQFT